ncbi:unnamed protein product [Oreochromis niloticus]|nr:unnamed protein product [Mustela putorius furo]
MVEVAGPEGAILVHSLTQSDIADATSHLPDPLMSGAKFGEQLLIFCQEYRPTGQEIRRALAGKLKPCDLRRISPHLPDPTLRIRHLTYEHGENSEYCTAVTHLMDKLKEVFPDKVDMSKIQACKQRKDESVDDFIYRMTTVFEANGGIPKDDMTGASASTYEHHLCGHIFRGLTSDVAAEEAIEGITPVFESLLKAGVIIPCPTSPVRTPLFPVKKIRGPNEPVEWRFVQDLQAVNKAVIPRAPVVPNPHTILSQIPSDAMWFTVADLTNAFFSVPVHPDSQFWFAFEFQGKAYTFTRLCQGYCESPTIYNAALRDSLSDLVLSQGTVLLQYVDDLLLCAPTQEQCLADSLALLTHLYNKGHKGSKSKLQFCKEQVTFLGHVISYNSHQISSKRVEAVMTIPKPLTKKQMMSFLGTTSYCRSFIPHYSSVEAPLTALMHGTSLSAIDRISWTPEAEAAFTSLKKLLQTALVLALPDPSKPYTQMVDEKNGFMSSVLLQQHGDSLRPVGYYSSKLDPVAAGLPGCLRAVAACEKAVLASRDIVGYSSILLDMPNITVKRCTTLNPATLLPTQEDGEPHSCTAVLGETCTPRIDLLDVPIESSDIVLYVDGSSSRDSRGTNRVGFAVCSDHATLVSGSLPRHFSAQTAELLALTEACKLGECQSATIYTDSRYAFGLVHDFAALWRHRKFLKSDGKPILNANQAAVLLDAILLPARIAVVKCAAHTGKTDSVSQGNAAADAAAKAAAKAAAAGGLPFQHVLASLSTPNLADLPAVQSFASQPEKTLWRKHGCTLVESVWRSHDGRPCLPKHFWPWFLKWTHGLDHVSKGGMLQAVTSLWFTKGFSTAADRYCKRCLICATNNVGRPVQDSPGTPSSESSPTQASRRTPAPVQTRELGASEGFQEETLEGEAVAGPIPSPTDHTNSGKGWRTSYLDPRQPL